MKPSATCHADVSARDADRFKQPFQKLLSNATPSAYSFLLFHQDASEQRKRRLHPMSALPPITPECTQLSMMGSGMPDPRLRNDVMAITKWSI